MFHHFHCFCVFSFFWLTLCINKSQKPLQTTNLCNISLFLSLTVSILLSAALSDPLIASNERRNAFAMFSSHIFSAKTFFHIFHLKRFTNQDLIGFTNLDLIGLIGICYCH
ncbi:hypothetical protein P8452_68119 [Trifolium repens]|nr:hypothetical protein P8452_68119 [Trifolium repens]